MRALGRAPLGRAGRGRHGPLSLASCVLQSPDGRGVARARAQVRRLLAGRRARWSRVCRERRQEREAPGAVGLGAGAGGDRHPRWWRGRERRSRDAAPRGFWRPHHDAERQCGGPVRPTQPIQGLSSRHGTRQCQRASLAAVLSNERDRAPAPSSGRFHQCRRSIRGARRRHPLFL